MVVFGQVLRNRKNAGLAVELDPVCRISCELDLASLGAKPRDHVPDRAAPLELLDHEYPIRRVFPNSQFVDCVAKHFFSRIAVPLLKRSIYVQESSFLQSRDGERNWAGTKDFLKFLFGKFPTPLRFRKGGLGVLQI